MSTLQDTGTVAEVQVMRAVSMPSLTYSVAPLRTVVYVLAPFAVGHVPDDTRKAPTMDCGGVGRYLWLDVQKTASSIFPAARSIVVRPSA